jgi:hypothetical protein
MEAIIGQPDDLGEAANDQRLQGAHHDAEAGARGLPNTVRSRGGRSRGAMAR